MILIILPPGARGGGPRVPPRPEALLPAPRAARPGRGTQRQMGVFFFFFFFIYIYIYIYICIYNIFYNIT